MTLVGAPDFQTQQAPPMTLLATVSLVNSGGVVQNIATKVMPYHQSIIAYWVGQGIGAGRSVMVSFSFLSSANPGIQRSTIRDGQYATWPLAGPQQVPSVNPTLNVAVQPDPDDPANTTGTCYIFAMTTPAMVTPRITAEVIGFINPIAPVLVPAGTTATVLGLLSGAKYYRVRCLTAVTTAAVGAAPQPWAWAELTGGVQLITRNAVAGQSIDVSIPCDFALLTGLKLVNSTNQGITASVVAEVWPN